MIKTAYIKPELIAEYYIDFLNLLTNKHNRLVWGGMIAIMTITELKHENIFASIDLISEAMAKGSVITTDCGIEILAKLNKYDKYFNKTEPLLTRTVMEMPN